MNRSHVAVSVLFALALAPASAAAQPAPRFTAGTSVHFARSWDDESMLGGGAATEGRFGVRLTPKTQVEFVVNRIPYERRFESGVATEGRSIFTGLMLKYDVTRGAARPYVLAGYGLNNHQGTRTSPGSPQFHTSTNDHGYVLGTGLAFSRGRWEIGPEGRIYMLAIERDASAAMVLSGGIRANMRF